jgi:hypothetical protein
MSGFLFTCLSSVIVGPEKLYVNQMLCDDCNTTTLHVTFFFCLFGSLVGECAVSISVCSFSIGKVNVLFICELSIEITKESVHN